MWIWFKFFSAIYSHCRSVNVKLAKHVCWIEKFTRRNDIIKPRRSAKRKRPNCISKHPKLANYKRVRRVKGDRRLRRPLSSHHVNHWIDRTESIGRPRRSSVQRYFRICLVLLDSLLRRFACHLLFQNHKGIPGVDDQLQESPISGLTAAAFTALPSLPLDVTELRDDSIDSDPSLTCSQSQLEILQPKEMWVFPYFFILPFESTGSSHERWKYGWTWKREQAQNIAALQMMERNETNAESECISFARAHIPSETFGSREMRLSQIPLLHTLDFELNDYFPQIYRLLSRVSCSLFRWTREFRSCFI